MNRGLNIGFCGIDGSGKSTQVRLLHQWLKARSYDVILNEKTRNFVSEISTSIGRRHGFSLGFEYLGQDFYDLAMSFEVLRQNTQEILPYTSVGITVISSRTVFDYLARAKARGCTDKTYEIIKEIILFAGTPDITIWIDTPPIIAYERILSRGYDHSDKNFLENFRTAFLELSAHYGWIRINGENDIDSIHHQIRQIVLKTEQNHC